MAITLVQPEPADERFRKAALESLELAMERVRSGETVTVGIVEVTRDHGTYTHWSEVWNVNTLLGAIERLKLKVHGAIG